MSIDRRTMLAGSSAIGTSLALSYRLARSQVHHPQRLTPSRVAVLHQDNYGDSLEDTLFRGLQSFALDLQGKSVLLKPNLVDYLPGDAINTHPALIRSAVTCFLRLGAMEVIVAEGPGNHRDTQLLVLESGLSDHLRESKARFVDLNRDELASVRLGTNYSTLGQLWLPKTVLRSDFVVSMPKIKTHHWAGVTLSMKNMFGVVPGSKYGWPKNILHWRGIDRCVIDIWTTVPVAFVIADGIVCMEGNGPINGSPRHLGRIVLADDPVAADSTCGLLMGLNALGVPHIFETSLFLGRADQRQIVQLGERVESTDVPFRVVPEFEHLRLRTS